MSKVANMKSICGVKFIKYFHGGCFKCKWQQIYESFEKCKQCQYMEADWSLPNLNTEDSSDKEVREQVSILELITR